MSAKTNLSVPNWPGQAPTISRREVARRLLAGIAVGLASPFSSPSHPLHKHLFNAALLDSAEAHLAANGKPLFLSAMQFADLGALSESIVPGSSKSQAAPFIDLLLSADTPQVQQEFLASLAVFESASHSAFQASLAALDGDSLQQLLNKLSAPDSADLNHFNNLREWIAGAYYSSELGMRELGWTPDRVFSEFPVCSHPEGHL